jgi:hypothetical protein
MYSGVNLKRLSFSDLPDHGIVIDEHLQAIYDRADSLWPDRPIIFDITYNEANVSGGVRVYQDSVTVWLKRASDDARHTLAHELAHVINERLVDSPCLDPNKPGYRERIILSDLINIPEHQKVHDLMAEYGFDTVREAREKSIGFLRNVASAPFDKSGKNVHLSVGYAMMLSVFRTEDLIGQISIAMHRKGQAVSVLGERLAEYVGSKRSATLYEDAIQLMKIAEISKSFQECVMSKEQFRAKYGWA